MVEPFLHVARLSDFPAGTGLAVRLDERPIALFHVDGEVFALDDACARCGESLASGALEDRDVECAGCGWRYNVVTGAARGVPNLRLDTFAVQTNGAIVSIANAFVLRSFR
jgi:nitrite reductase/ring-hydroxylating ferredoxin subunit